MTSDVQVSRPQCVRVETTINRNKKEKATIISYGRVSRLAAPRSYLTDLFILKITRCLISSVKQRSVVTLTTLQQATAVSVFLGNAGILSEAC